jgi:hypothetical protein
MSSAASPSMSILNRFLPRTADRAHEGLRHASRCDTHLGRARVSLDELHRLLAERSVPAELVHGRLLDADAHLRVLEQKGRIYGAICAALEAVDSNLRSAKRELDLLGSSSTEIMRCLRIQTSTPMSEACREVAAHLVEMYSHRADLHGSLSEAMRDALPDDVPRRSAR